MALTMKAGLDSDEAKRILWHSMLGLETLQLHQLFGHRATIISGAAGKGENTYLCRVSGFGEVDSVNSVDGGPAILAARLAPNRFVMPSLVRLEIRSNSLDAIRRLNFRASTSTQHRINLYNIRKAFYSVQPPAHGCSTSAV